MKIYFSYKDNGEFDGFYNDEINKKIPVESVEITQELQNELLTGLWSINIEKLDDIKGVLDIDDKDSFFLKHDIEAVQYINPEQQALLKQLALNKISNMQKDKTISDLANQIALNKLDSMQKDMIINNLSKQVANNKLELMELKNKENVVKAGN